MPAVGDKRGQMPWCQQDSASLTQRGTWLTRTEPPQQAVTPLSAHIPLFQDRLCVALPTPLIIFTSSGAPSWFKCQTHAAITSQILFDALFLNAESSQIKHAKACVHLLLSALPILRNTT